MARTIRPVLLLFMAPLSLATGGCEGGSVATGHGAIEATVRAATESEQDPNRRFLGTRSDWSGDIVTGTWVCESTTRSQHQSVACSVDEGWVLVGGGATAVYHADGALLTTSWPDPFLTMWIAESKDHIHPDFHDLVVFAIGLQVKGFGEGELRDQMAVADGTTGDPLFGEAHLPPGFAAISGGTSATYSGEGVMLVDSSASGTDAWSGRARDHLHADPTGRVTARVIGLRDIINGVAFWESTFSFGSDHVTSSVANALVTVPEGWVGVSAGAFSAGAAPGRLLFSAAPTAGDLRIFTAKSKDHIQPASGLVELSVNSIRKAM